MRLLLALMVLTAASAGAAAGGAAGAVAPPHHSQQTRPNVIVIETDDQDQASMEFMDKTLTLIGDGGVTFDNSFVSFPLCCPSRSTFLTGEYAHNHGITSNDPPTGGYQVFDNLNALPAWLQSAGYYTVEVGRYLNHYGKDNPTEIPPGWSEWHATVDPSTYNYYNYTINQQGGLVYYGDRAQDYQTDVLGSVATEVLSRRLPDRQPLFMWLTTMAPHDAGPREPDDPPHFPTTVPPPRYAGIYGAEPLPKDPSFNEFDISDKPAEVRRRRRLRDTDISAIRYAYRQRIETLQAVDDLVGGVVRTIQDAGELQDTLIIYTSDNGYLQGQHRIRAGKVFLYEPSIRVPLLMRGPGIPRGVHVRSWASNVDLAPTILDATRAVAGRTQDGRSLFPLIKDRGLSWGRELLLDAGPYQGVRTDRYVYAEHKTGEKELYDLQADPYETHNLWHDRASRPIWDALAGQLSRLRTCSGANCQRGPRLKLELRTRGHKCAKRVVVAHLRGTDNHYAISLRVSAGDYTLTDSRAPFAVPLRARTLGRTARIRALAVLKDGRRLTIDRTAHGC
ncbi:MAG: sulfatase [Thermoleophilaceae bacterium]